MATLELRSVSKAFKTGKVLDGVSLAAKDGEIICIFGPSGAGKTVLLRLVAGVEQTDEGAIFLGGRDVTDTAPETRGVGMAFQNFALFPHMIAHEFQISQQEPDARAADLLEIYAPLFATLIGKEQVLLPHCVTVTGANDVNLFRNPEGNYVAPVTSRTRFLSRRVAASETAIVSLRVPDFADLKWAHIYSADAPPCRGTVTNANGESKIEIRHHGTASMVVVGKGTEPSLNDNDSARLGQLRDRLFGIPGPATTSPVGRPAGVDLRQASVRIEGTQVGQWGLVGVLINGKPAGAISSAFGTFPLSSAVGTIPPTVTLTVPDEGMWFVPQHIDLVAPGAEGKQYRIAQGTPDDAARAGNFIGDIELHLQWCAPEEVK